MFVFLQAGGADFDPAAARLGRQSGPLKIGLFPGHAGMVVFGGADTVGITADHLATFTANRTQFHVYGILLTYIMGPGLL